MLQEELFKGAWNDAIQRFRPPFVYRGLSDATYRLETSLMRLGGPFRITSYNVCYTKLLRCPKSNNDGKASHILRPSSAMGVPHLLQRTLQGRMRSGRFCSLLKKTRFSKPAVNLTWCLWKIAAHCIGAPCNLWQVVQWQILASTGSGRTSYRTTPQKHEAWYLTTNPVSSRDA